MSTGDNLSPPGSSTYDSSSMYVGDGTWDSDRNTFLLPNLQGLNFATMQYNGMGNRFRDLPEYHVLVTGHGVIAAITFLGIVPGAIFIARFLHTEGRVAFKLHVYMQIITVFLATVVLVLGWFAVGPERSLTNPHHGIGVAIYVCILVQFLYGWWMTRRERKRTRPHPTIPVKVHLHRLFGRAVALLAFVQVALGLTLYGSPKVLFILYALWGALLLFAYLALEYRNKARLVGAVGPPPRPAQSDYYSDYTGSYITGDQTQLTGDGRRRDRSRDRSHWGRNILAGAGLIGAYEWYRRKRDDRRVEKDNTYYEDSEMTGRPPHTPGRPGSSMGPPRPGPGPRIPDPYGPTPVAGYGPTPSAGYGPPPGSVPPPATYAGARPPSRGSNRARRNDGTMMSPQSWEDDEMAEEKYGRRPERGPNTWRDRILGAGAGIAAFEGVKSMFGGRKRRNDGYVDSQVSYRPGDQSMVSQTDVSRVEAGQAPFSPGDQRPGRRVRVEDTSTMTPTRPGIGRRPTGIPPRRSSMDSMSYDDDESYVNPPPRRPADGGQTLRESIAAMGAVAGFREWNRRRRDRREQDRNDQIRRQELDSEEQFNRRNSNRYPRPQDASGRRESLSGTIMTGPQDPTVGSHPELSRTNFRPDTLQPPLPAAAGTIPSASGAPPSTVGPSISQQHVPQPPPHGQHQQQTTNINFPIPPPPPGPPPNASRPADYQAPVPGSLAMPQGAVYPDPSRLVSEQTQTQQQGTGGMYRDGTSTAAEEAAVAAAGLAAGQRTQSQSPSRRRGSRTRQDRRGSSAAASGSRNDNGGISSPPVSLKMNVHPDGGAVTLRRLNEQEAAAERAARRRERRTRRGSSLSSGGEEPGSSRYRRNGAIRRSSDQPITNVPPPPAMSSSAGGSHRPPSELNLPPVPAPGRVPQASDSPVPPAGLLPAAGPAGSGAVGSPPNVAGTGTDMGTGTDVSVFESNRRRRRAERMRREQAAGGGGNRVEFE
ncbi:hypothetical protein M409DRAFT_49848 [Zasmidium cellare ATCC 36951]|uniref:Cytochrome b561 domain-containing protein n=1 Tax=Zasmidium cellare ATCC 36951 TaxID=1080233 RepID=A0A6A6D1Y6_ZASCE|nr:uncharacterized protein M409DRAFT_49848 [Zasmidium cellare ATCC 36951]KAF2172099.1 hypothetical protein M409DRAFT_49848 [Zasmidium cellare ATCC 36951]